MEPIIVIVKLDMVAGNVNWLHVQRAPRGIKLVQADPIHIQHMISVIRTVTMSAGVHRNVLES